MMYATGDDFRQIYVVAKNEITKFVRGKRFTLYVALILIIFACSCCDVICFNNDCF
jgi:hypothetical protein